jgi:hypothetical protein
LIRTAAVRAAVEQAQQSLRIDAQKISGDQNDQRTDDAYTRAAAAAAPAAPAGIAVILDIIAAAAVIEFHAALPEAVGA